MTNPSNPVEKKELRIVNSGGMYHGFRDGAERGFRAETVMDVFTFFYGEPGKVEKHTFEIVEKHIHDGMALWLFGNGEWWFSQIGGVDMEPDNELSILSGESVKRGISFKQYSVGASRINWTDAISRMCYDYEQSVWWRDIHNAGTRALTKRS